MMQQSSFFYSFGITGYVFKSYQQGTKCIANCIALYRQAQRVSDGFCNWWVEIFLFLHKDNTCFSCRDKQIECITAVFDTIH